MEEGNKITLQQAMRHSRATDWIAQGQPLEFVMKALGHTTTRTTQRYVAVAGESLRRLVE